MVVKLIAEKISKRFHGTSLVAVEEVDLSINQGEVVCILGPSGCGKSTFLNILAGFIAPTTGRVMIDGRPADRIETNRVMVFQDFALFPWRTVLGNVEFGLEMAGVLRSQRQQRAQKYIELVGLSSFQHSYPSQLSGGMKQRVAIARALAIEPEILLMDEPFGSLDAQTRELMQEELLKIWEATRKTIVFVTHGLDESVYLADRIVLMTARPGRIKKVIDVGLARPRYRTDPGFNRVMSEINAELRSEVLRSAATQPV